MQAHDDFLRLVGELFPALRVELDEPVIAGLLHPQMGRFAQVTQAAIDAGDLDTAQAHFHLVEQLMADPSPELENALDVSFFEMLDFDGPNGRAAWEVLPPALQKAWQEMQDYLVRLAKDANALKDKRQ